MCGKELMKELQPPPYHTNRKAWKRLCYMGVEGFCQLQSRGFAPGEGYPSILQHHTVLSGRWLVGQ